MEAGRNVGRSVIRIFCFITLSITLLVSLIHCGPKGQVTTQSECASQAMAKSFLIKWKKTIPPEYAHLRLNPQSLTTRFENIEKSVLEDKILSTHLSQYEYAEPEYLIENVTETIPMKDETSSTSLVVDPPPVWAPQDIQASDAWALLGKKGEGVVVAVIDSGIYRTHPLLQSQIWKNPGETGLDKNGNDKATNGIDDDGNGLIDDSIGWNFDENDTNVTDEADHGTHVSGIIAGQADAASGFTGVAPGAKIMPLRFIAGDGSGSVTSAISAIDYATQHGARVINASWGGATCSNILKQQIQAAALNGTVFVNAAGNGDSNGVGFDISQIPEWPAVYQIAGKLTVGAYNLKQILSRFSNFGALVDLAAPGESITSTVPPKPNRGALAGKSGTSMATPYVAGVVALLISAKPDASVGQITDAISNSVVPGKFGVRSGGKLNALNAAKYLLSH